MKKYTALRFVATFHEIAGCLLAAAGLLWFLLTMFPTPPRTDAVFLVLAQVLGLMFSGVFVFAFRQLIYVFIDIEANTRRLDMAGAKAVGVYSRRDDNL
jgi:hypothetical protein